MTNFGIKEVYLEIARGNVPGMTAYRIAGRKDSISTTVLDDISQIPATTVVPNPGGIQLQVVSSSINDDGSPAGTGLQTVKLVYLDTAGNMQSESLTLDGTTPVLTVATDIDKIQWLEGDDVGSNTVAAGNIQIETVGGGTIYEYIVAGGNQSLSARFHIPLATTGYIFGYFASGITKKIDFRMRANVSRLDRSLTGGAFLFQGVAVTNDNNTGWIEYAIPVKLPALSTVKTSAISSAAGGDAGVEFMVLVIDD